MDSVKGLLKQQVLILLAIKDKKISAQQLRKAFYLFIIFYSCTIKDPADIWVFPLSLILFILFYDYTLLHNSNYTAGSYEWHLMTKVLRFIQ